MSDEGKPAANPPPMETKPNDSVDYQAHLVAEAAKQKLMKWILVPFAGLAVFFYLLGGFGVIRDHLLDIAAKKANQVATEATTTALEKFRNDLASSNATLAELRTAQAEYQVKNEHLRAANAQNQEAITTIEANSTGIRVRQDEIENALTANTTELSRLMKDQVQARDAITVSATEVAKLREALDEIAIQHHEMKLTAESLGQQLQEMDLLFQTLSQIEEASGPELITLIKDVADLAARPEVFKRWLIVRRMAVVRLTHLLESEADIDAAEVIKLLAGLHAIQEEADSERRIREHLIQTGEDSISFAAEIKLRRLGAGFGDRVTMPLSDNVTRLVIDRMYDDIRKNKAAGDEWRRSELRNESFNFLRRIAFSIDDGAALMRLFELRSGGVTIGMLRSWNNTVVPATDPHLEEYLSEWADRVENVQDAFDMAGASLFVSPEKELAKRLYSMGHRLMTTEKEFPRYYLGTLLMIYHNEHADDPSGDIIALLRRSHRLDRPYLLRLAGSVKKPSPELVELLFKYRRDKNDEVAAEAIVSLGRLMNSKSGQNVATE